MGTGPPRLRRRLIVVLALPAMAGLSAAPAARADNPVGAGASPATALAAIDPAVPAAGEPEVAGLVESVPALEPAPAIAESAKGAR